MSNTFDLDPFDVKTAVAQTSIDHLEADEVYVLAVKLAEDVQALYPFVRETPRWESLWDQCQRASSSVALNYAQALGKLRGFTQNDMLVSRAEGMELFAGLSIGPPCFRALKPQAKELLAIIDSRILGLPGKEDRPYHKN